MQILHAGCGREPLPEWLSEHEETRLDIDPGVFPDVVAPLTDLGDIGPYTLEHLYPHQVALALAEFRRVLMPGGACVIVVPDLEGVVPDDTVVYDSPGGPITGRDMFYGKASMVADNEYMAHKTGFTPSTLRKAMEDAGFEVLSCDGKRQFNIMAVGKA